LSVGLSPYESRGRGGGGGGGQVKAAACSQAFRGSVETRGDRDWHRVCVEGGEAGKRREHKRGRASPYVALCPLVLDACKKHIALPITRTRSDRGIDATAVAPGPERCPRMSWINGYLVARVDDRHPVRRRQLRRALRMAGRPLWESGGWGGRVGLKSVDLGFETSEVKGRKVDGSGCDGSSDDTASGAGSVTAADCWQRVVRVFQSKKFQSRKLERLYQRYFFRLNQSSLTMLMGVLVIVCGVMLTFHCIHGPPYVVYACVLSVAMALFLALMVVCNRNGFHQDYMWMASYLVIGVLIVVQVFGVLMVAPRSASEGIWWSVFFIYIIYTLLPVRMRAAVLSGGVLSSIHLLTTWRINQDDEFLWKQ
ncbi:hypothetical protein cypCar_00035680, partial [Cyprinus carpio]